jgi:lipoprotein-anchoring transpeptidase ErfK/SrfK
VGTLRRLVASGSAVVLALAAVSLVAPAPSALAAGPAVTLAASASSVTYGEPVTLSGAIDPPAAGETVEVRDDDGALLATASTDADGAFVVSLTLERSVTLTAAWGSAVSEPVTVGVRAVVSVRMGPVRLFDLVRIRGTVRPALAGEHARVVLLRADRPVDAAWAPLDAAGRFEASFQVMHPGRYRARVAFRTAALLRGSATTPADATPLPSLDVGSRGTFVRLLERRLAELRYRIVDIDTAYDFRTGDAVLAFRKVQGMPRVTGVRAATWRALADPLLPRPRLDTRAFHVEVDQTKQVLYTVEDRVVTNIIHVSTGANGATHDGSFRVYRKLAGYSPNRLYYPSYFDGLRAIHGWPEVPTYPASHGCVRVPYWHARWIFGLVPIGTRVVIYHS